MLQAVRGVAACRRRRSRAGVHAVRRYRSRDAAPSSRWRKSPCVGQINIDSATVDSRGLFRRGALCSGERPGTPAISTSTTCSSKSTRWIPATACSAPIAPMSSTGRSPRPPRRRVQIAGTSLAVDQSGSFSVCARLSAGSVAGTAYRTDFIVVERDRVMANGSPALDRLSRRAALRVCRVCGHLRPQGAGRGCPLSHGHGGAAAGRGHPERGQPPGRLPGADPGDQARPEKRPVPPHARDAVPVQPGPTRRPSGRPCSLSSSTRILPRRTTASG